MAKTWREYEKDICEAFRTEYPDAKILVNQYRVGRYSKAKRQIDILIEGQIAGNLFSIVIDGKFYGRKVHVKGVESFISMVSDIGANKGLIITQKGYTRSAINRAYNDPLDIEVDILSFEQLKEFQGFEAIPYSGNAGAVLRAPFGWVIDGHQYEKPFAPAHIYQRGLTLAEAFGRKELIYVRFWDRAKNGEDTTDLLAIQKKNFEQFDPGVKIEYPSTITRNDAPTVMRLAIVPRYGGIHEYTGFVEFKNFILFLVLFTPPQLAKKNVRKLESVMLNALPMTVTYSAKPAKSDVGDIQVG